MRVSELAERLVIGASYSMSLYCYSILRLDPYVGCGHGCTYCFTRFMPRRIGNPRPLWNYSKALDRVFTMLTETPVILMPFRMSALTDPLQPLERKVKLGLSVLEVVRHHAVPILLSTKSTLVIKSPWLDLIKELAGEGRLVVQITLITLVKRVSKILEPYAPSPEMRLRAIEHLADEGIPVVVRLQPLIPFINDDPRDLEDLLDHVAAAGARQIIVEYYRFLSWSDLEIVARAADPQVLKLLMRRALWERYPTGVHKRPRSEYRLARYKIVRDLASRRGLLFSTCREGTYALDTAPDCCGIHFMKKYKLRPTLREYLENIRDRKFVSAEDLISIPLVGLRRKLLEHYKYLEHYVESQRYTRNKLV